jgi:predicted metal-dependent phosphoesterase TrpH
MISKADVHVHTKFSGMGSFEILRFPESVSDPEDVVRIARKVGLRVLCITDHDAVEGAFRARKFAEQFDDIEVVIGEEITTSEGEIIGLFLTEWVKPYMTAAETCAEVRRQGGLTIAPHPFSQHVPALGERVETEDIDAIEALNGGHIDGHANHAAQERGKSGKWALVGGSDAHSLLQVGQAWTEFEGETAEDFRRCLLEKRTKPAGKVMTTFMGANWSVGIVLQADKLMIKSLFGMLEGADENDPIVRSVRKSSPPKRLLALIGSLFFLVPPIPFLVTVYGERVMRRWNDPHGDGGRDLKDSRRH